VLQSCTYSFNRSGVYLLTGPNGSGKSTFLRLCALLEKPDRGSIQYRSSQGAVEPRLSLKRRFTLVLPDIGPFNTTVLKNVAFGLKLRHVPKRETRKRVAEALDLVGLLAKKRQNAMTLSSGETQRMGIARAIVLKPEVLFLDEPTAFVDRESKRIIEKTINRLREKGQTMILLATHDWRLAERIADHILVMEQGRLLPA